MPELRNPRQEAMAQALALGKTQLAAYAEAGYTGDPVGSAAKRANHPDVKTRVHEIIAERHQLERRSSEKAVEDASIEKGWIVRRAKFIVDRAIRGTRAVYDKDGTVSWMPRAGDDTAAINGLKLLAQMGGYLVEKVEFGQPGDFARLTDDELDKELLLVAESIGISPSAVQKAIAGRSE